MARMSFAYILSVLVIAARGMFGRRARSNDDHVRSRSNG